MGHSSARLLRLAARDGEAIPASIAGSRPASPAPIDPAALVAMVRARDPRAAALIWDQYSGLVRAVLCRTVGPSVDIDDLLQDVFVGFFRNVGELRDPGALKSFLIGIAIRTARSSLRKRRVRRWLHLTDSGDVPEVATATADPRTREAMRHLYAVLDELADRDRLAFVLRYGEEYELTEVAEAIGCSLATAKRCILRAEEHVNARARSDVHLSQYMGAGDREGGIDDTR